MNTTFESFQKSAENDFSLTATITLKAQGNGTQYTATVLHGDEKSCEKHRARGFEEGWGKALGQLVATLAVSAKQRAQEI